MTVIPGSKLGLWGNYQCVTLLNHSVVLTQHTWAFSFLLHNQIYPRKKKWVPPLTPNFCPLTWDSVMEMEREDATSKPYYIESHLQSECPCKGTFYSQDKHLLSCSNPKTVPFQSFPMAWPIGSQGEGTSRLVQECPEWRSWWETGELSPTTETPNLFQTAGDINLKKVPPECRQHECMMISESAIKWKMS